MQDINHASFVEWRVQEVGAKLKDFKEGKVVRFAKPM